MNEHDIDPDLIDRYLHGKLSEAEQESVEIRILNDSAFFEAVQQADQLHQGMQDNADLLQSKVVPLPTPVYWRSPPLALAASLCMGILISAIYFQSTEQSGAASMTDEGLALSSVVRLEPVRGEVNHPRLDGAVQHLLQLDTGMSLNPAPWQLSVAGEDGTRSDYVIAADGNGMLNFVTAAGMQGTYTFGLQQQGNETVTEYVLTFE